MNQVTKLNFLIVSLSLKTLLVPSGNSEMGQGDLRNALQWDNRSQMKRFVRSRD